MTNLAPCPFCGSEAARIGPYGEEGLFGVQCLRCNAGVRGYDQCSQDAVDAWNTRLAAARPQEPVAWQPIETAPKDGTRVLVADMDVWVAVARNWPCNGYWIEDAASGMRLNEPTHWHPLPKFTQTGDLQEGK